MITIYHLERVFSSGRTIFFYHHLYSNESIERQTSHGSLILSFLFFLRVASSLVFVFDQRALKKASSWNQFRLKQTAESIDYLDIFRFSIAESDSIQWISTCFLIKSDHSKKEGENENRHTCARKHRRTRYSIVNISRRLYIGEEELIFIDFSSQTKSNETETRNKTIDVNVKDKINMKNNLIIDEILSDQEQTHSSGVKSKLMNGY